jgi:hypothetical protein
MVQNVEVVKKSKIYIDKTAPTLSLDKKIVGLYRVKCIADVEDGMSGVEKVCFYLDEVYRYTDNTNPFEWIWEGTGDHIITSEAYDIAGNINSKEIPTTSSFSSNNPFGYSD